MKLRLGGFYEGKKVTTCLVSGPGGKWQCRFQILIGDFDFFFFFFFLFLGDGRDFEYSKRWLRCPV